jgi:hypothetical protein
MFVECSYTAFQSSCVLARVFDIVDRDVKAGSAGGMQDGTIGARRASTDVEQRSRRSRRGSTQNAIGLNFAF